MTWWKFWQRKEKAEEPEVSVPTITIEGLMDGNVFIKADWPRPENQNQAALIARELANMMYMVSVGDLLGTMYQAIAVAGNQMQMDGIANNAIEMTNRAMQQRAGHDQDAKLVVSPDEVFRTL